MSNQHVWSAHGHALEKPPAAGKPGTDQLGALVHLLSHHSFLDHLLCPVILDHVLAWAQHNRPKGSRGRYSSQGSELAHDSHPPNNHFPWACNDSDSSISFNMRVVEKDFRWWCCCFCCCEMVKFKLNQLAKQAFKQTPVRIHFSYLFPSTKLFRVWG